MADIIRLNVDLDKKLKDAMDEVTEELSKSTAWLQEAFQQTSQKILYSTCAAACKSAACTPVVAALPWRAL